MNIKSSRTLLLVAAIAVLLAGTLSALKINVDTTGGRVVLRGTAPDTASRERATVLASAVSGVVSVENALTVSRN